MMVSFIWQHFIADIMLSDFTLGSISFAHHIHFYMTHITTYINILSLEIPFVRSYDTDLYEVDMARFYRREFAKNMKTAMVHEKSEFEEIAVRAFR